MFLVDDVTFMCEKKRFIFIEAHQYSVVHIYYTTLTVDIKRPDTYIDVRINEKSGKAAAVCSQASFRI